MITRATPTDQTLAYQRGYDAGKEDGAAGRTNHQLWWQAEHEVNRNHRWTTQAGAEAAGYRDGWRDAKGLDLEIGKKLEILTVEPPRAQRKKGVQP